MRRSLVAAQSAVGNVAAWAVVAGLLLPTAEQSKRQEELRMSSKREVECAVRTDMAHGGGAEGPLDGR